MKLRIAFYVVFLFSLISCSRAEEISLLKTDIVGTWVARQDEILNIYEFYEDGSGLMRDSSENFYAPVSFVYEFVEDEKLEFSAQENYSIFVDIKMPTSSQLVWDADVTGGYHIDFNKVGECELDSLEKCMVGRWIRHFPNDKFTIYEFYRTGEGAEFAPEFVDAEHFKFSAIDPNSILFEVGNSEPTEVNVSLPDNYKMIFEFVNGETETITFYRVDAPH